MLVKPHFWFPVYPDLVKPIGGVKQIHRVAEQLIFLGYQVTLVQHSATFRPSWFSSSINTISKDSWFSLDNLVSNKDVIVLPETFLPVIQSCFPSLKKIIFNQNCSYTFGLPSHDLWDPSSVIKAYMSPSILQIWCVSKYDYEVLTKSMLLPPNKVSLLTNGIEPNICIPPRTKKKYQIAYMPRKNSRDSRIVCTLIKNQSWSKGWSFIPIEDMSHLETIQTLQDSLIFLSFGYPEGFGLPVAEALACGCAVIGYSGLGGRELFNIPNHNYLTHHVEYGDWNGFVDGVMNVVQAIHDAPSIHISHVLKMSAYICDKYGEYSFRNSIKEAVSLLHASKV